MKQEITWVMDMHVLAVVHVQIFKYAVAMKTFQQWQFSLKGHLLIWQFFFKKYRSHFLNGSSKSFHYDYILEAPLRIRWQQHPGKVFIMMTFFSERLSWSTVLKGIFHQVNPLSSPGKVINDESLNYHWDQIWAQIKYDIYMTHAGYREPQPENFVKDRTPWMNG